MAYEVRVAWRTARPRRMTRWMRVYVAGDVARIRFPSARRARRARLATSTADPSRRRCRLPGWCGGRPGVCANVPAAAPGCSVVRPGKPGRAACRSHGVRAPDRHDSVVAVVIGSSPRSTRVLRVLTARATGMYLKLHAEVGVSPSAGRGAPPAELVLHASGTDRELRLGLVPDADGTG